MTSSNCWSPTASATTFLLFLLTAASLLPVMVTSSMHHHHKRVPNNIGAAEEYCEREYFEASCSSAGHIDQMRSSIGEVILMKTALYGRMKVGRCVKSKEYGSIGCHANVIDLVDSKCTGRSHCKFPITDLHSSKPCPSELMAYLEASYDCVPVASCPPSSCLPGQAIRPQGHEGPTDGYLSSIVASKNGCGSPSCPWLLEPAPGQKFNLTFYTPKNFALSDSLPPFSKFEDKQKIEKLCQRLANIFFVSSQVSKDVTSCGVMTSQRFIHVISPASEKVEIKLYSGMPESQVHYLVKYEVIGCPDLEAPKNGHTVRQGDTTTVFCNEQQKAWHLTCVGTSWVGDVGVCEDAEPKPSWSVHAALEKASTTTHGILLVVGLGIVIGVVIGCSLLAVVIVVLKRRRLKQAIEQERRLEMLTQYSLDIPSEHHKQHQQQQQHYLHYQQQQPYQDLPQTRIYPDEEGGGGALYGGGMCHGVVVAATCDSHCCSSPRMTCGQGHDCVKNSNSCKTTMASNTADIIRSLQHKDHTYESPNSKNNFNLP